MTETVTSSQERYQHALMNTFGPPKLVLTRGQGARVWDEDGKEYVDLLGGIAVNALGHGHPALVKAVTDQLSTLGHISNFFASGPQIALAERLLEILAETYAEPGTPAEPVEAKVFFTNSGTEANEAAFKLSRRTGRTHIVAMKGSFHGRTMGALALTSKETYRAPFEPLPGDVTFVEYGDAAALAAAVTDRTAAIVIEPIQGEAGVVVPPADFLSKARAIADEHGALLWFDEVQTGMGRTGTWLAHAVSGATPHVVKPDVITLAKGLGGGFPIGACIGLGAAADLLQPGNHGTTFGGNPPACAAALAVIDTIASEGLLERVTTVGQRLRDSLAADRRVTDVTGEGLLIGVVTTVDTAKVVAAALAQGFILNNATPERLRLAPPLVLSDEDVDDFLAAWPAILDAAEAWEGDS